MTSTDPSSRPVTLITGGTSGIGASTVRHLLRANHRVTVTGRDSDRLAKLVSDLDDLATDDTVLPILGDATDYASVADAVGATVRKYGRLDNAIANAGFSTGDTLVNGDPDRWREMVLTNVLGPALLIKAALPALKQTHGRILLLGSVAGLKNTPGNMYSVTKWAVTALAENARMLATAEGVGVTLVAPGRVDTPFWGDRTLEGPVLTADTIAEMITWALGQPAEVDVNTITVRPVGQTN